VCFSSPLAFGGLKSTLHPLSFVKKNVQMETYFPKFVEEREMCCSEVKADFFLGCTFVAVNPRIWSQDTT
jgi:hypothetical protein